VPFATESSAALDYRPLKNAVWKKFGLFSDGAAFVLDKYLFFRTSTVVCELLSDGHRRGRTPNEPVRQPAFEEAASEDRHDFEIRLDGFEEGG
jgi:hypothetical protein